MENVSPHLSRVWQHVSWQLDNLQEQHQAPPDQDRGVEHRQALQEEAQRRQNKSGTVNIAASESNKDFDSEGNGTTKATTSKLSELTEGTGGPYPAYSEYLRITGHISTNIGIRETDSKIYEEEKSCNGDVPANLGVGFLQVQDEK